LQALDLSFTKVNDASLAHFQELKNLKELVVRDTQVTSAGIQAWRKAMPKVNIAGR
jgi:hypothetical protein